MKCEYGCDQEAKYYLSTARNYDNKIVGKWCCSKSQNSCLEIRRKFCEANKGKKHSEETKKKISENLKKMSIKTKHKSKCIDCGKELSKNKCKRCKLCSAKNNGLNRRKPKNKCIDCGKELSKFIYERCQSCSGKYRRKNPKTQIIRRETCINKYGVDNVSKVPEIMKKASTNSGKSNKKRWDSLSKEQKVLELSKRFSKKPNRFESEFDNSTPKNIRFTGNRSFWLWWKNQIPKNPDFKVKGQRKLIELFGDYWHKPEEERLYKEEYGKIGYDCIVIWQSDWIQNRTQILQKINSFISV